MKKSFLLHIDSLCILDKMSNEQAGIFFKAIYHYQVFNQLPNDLDLVIEIAITPFINQFKRDDEKYKKEIEVSSEKGKLGNLKRWHIDLYNQVINNQIDINEATIIAKNRPPDTPRTPPIPKSLVNDSVNDNVSVSDNKNDINIIVDEIYKLYPSTCPYRNSSTGKSTKSKDKIKKLLAKHTKEDLTQRIKNYLKSCEPSKTYLKNFDTFLNNLPDLVVLNNVGEEKEFTHVVYRNKDSFDPTREENAPIYLFEQYLAQGKNLELVKYYKPYEPK